MIKVPLDLYTKYLYSTSGSASSIIKHNTALHQIGLNVNYFTIKEAITPEIYCGLLRSPFSLGGAVTAQGGLKSTIIPFLDEVDFLAQRALAVNTVIHRNGKLLGYNTDAYGLLHALKERIAASEHPIRTAVIYGNGGVSGVAWHILKELGLEVAFRGRNAERVLQKRTDLNIDHLPEPSGPFDLVIDATPISASPDFIKAKGFKEILAACKMVFCHNMPEKDGKNNFLEAYCNSRDITFIPGADMYRGQLIKQYALFLENIKKPDGSQVSESDIIKAWNL